MIAPTVKRAAIYFSSELHRALKIKAARCNSSISEPVQEAARLMLMEDMRDLEVIAGRKTEPERGFNMFVKELKKMGSYRLKIKKGAEKEIIKLPRADRKKVVRKIFLLSSNPRPRRCEKLEGNIYCRIRQGNFRIVYGVNDIKKLVRIIKAGHKREVYR